MGHFRLFALNIDKDRCQTRTFCYRQRTLKLFHANLIRIIKQNAP